MIHEDKRNHDVSYWPSISDLFMTLFITAVAIIGVVLFVFLPGKATKEPIVDIKECNRIVAELDQSLNLCQEQIKKSEAKILELQKNLEDCNKRCGTNNADCKTPIIMISSGKNFFPTGRSEINDAFALDLNKGAFQEIADEIIRRNKIDALKVDTLEVIGHTDGVPFKGNGNLDVGLPSVLLGATKTDHLIPGSNNDLGLLRALAIKQAWQQFINDHPDRAQLDSIEVRTYSAGQTVPVEPGRFESKDPRARRIELRLTKLH